MPDSTGTSFIDCHVHFSLEHFDDFTGEFDAAGLMGAWNIVRVPAAYEGATWKEFHALVERSLAHKPYPVFTFYWPDYSGLTDPAFPKKCARRIRELSKRGIAGLKVWKDMGLGLKGPDGKLMMLDDERLDPLWEALIDLKLILIAHVADPANFWLPFDETNPSYEALKRRPDWHFGKPGLPSHTIIRRPCSSATARNPSWETRALAILPSDCETLQ